MSALQERFMYVRQCAEFLTPRGNRATMHYRADTNDWNTIIASMSSDEYGLAGLHLTGLAVDIGAYVGSVGIALALDNPELKVICIEPVIENVELIRANIEANGLKDRVDVLRVAAAAPGVEETSVRWRYRGSELADHHAFVGNVAFIQGAGATGVQFDEALVCCFSLSRLASTYGPISFLKIDCEGCEWPAFTDPAARDIPIIVGEVHPTEGHRPADLAAVLPAHDVRLIGEYQETGPCGFEARKR